MVWEAGEEEKQMEGLCTEGGGRTGAWEGEEGSGVPR